MTISSISGNEGSSIALPVWAGLSDMDGTETLKLTISGVPASASLSQGQKQADGIWEFSTSGAILDLSTLTLQSPSDGKFTLNIAATSVANNGTTSTMNATVALTVMNVAPTIGDASFDVVENSPAGTFVGTLTGTDPGADVLTYSITGGTGATAFAIDPMTGEITVADSSQLDFETITAFNLQVTVTDDAGASATSDVTINLINLASLAGAVFVDIDQDGEYDANEIGIDGVTIELLNDQGTIIATAVTSNGGLYLFEDLAPGRYYIREIQPSGVSDGAEKLGSLGGSIVANDLMEVTLGHTDAENYNFAEIGQAVSSGDTATIGFWQNKHGQSLIQQGGIALAKWLTDNFGNVFGDQFVGASGADVATFYKDQLFKQMTKKSAGPAKVDAQFMAVAFATFFTSDTLSGNVAAAYGFNVTDTGIGTKVINVGNSGKAFEVADGSDRTILQLLLATNALTDQANGQNGFASIYDRNGDGVISVEDGLLRTLANDVYNSINKQSDI